MDMQIVFTVLASVVMVGIMAGVVYVIVCDERGHNRKMAELDEVERGLILALARMRRIQLRAERLGLALGGGYELPPETPKGLEWVDEL